MWLALAFILAPQDQHAFLEDAPKAWLVLRDAYREKDCTRETSRNGSPLATVVVRRNGSSLLIHSTPRVDGWDERIYCTNDRYSFSILKSKSMNGFSLEMVEPPWPEQSYSAAKEIADQIKAASETEPPKPVKINQSFQDAAFFLSAAELGCSSIGLTVPIPAIPWHDSRQVVITNCTSGMNGSRRTTTVSVDFHLDMEAHIPAPTGEVISNIPDLQSGTFVFAPDSYWVPISAILTLKHSEGTSTCKWDWSYDWTESVPLVTSATRVITDGSYKGYSFKHKISYAQPGTSAEDYTLPFYGLPEPPGVGGAKWSWMYPVLGAILIVFGVILIKRKRLAG